MKFALGFQEQAITVASKIKNAYEIGYSRYDSHLRLCVPLNALGEALRLIIGMLD